MKAVLLSIKPKYCELIADGRKTIELRKTIPKQLKPPFKCYIYCTKPRFDWEDYIVIDIGTEKARDFLGGGKVIGKFICDYIIGHCESSNADIAEQRACVKREDIFKYANGKQLYGWHISNLKIFDTPKELSDFYKRSPCKHYQKNTYVSIFDHCNYAYPCERIGEFETYCQGKKLTRPPQSWCYVEEIE